MIPPEPGPGPDPPLPDVPEYSYSSSEPITLFDSVTGTLYKGIQLNGVDCKLLTENSGGYEKEYNDLILYEVGGTDYCYFARYFSPNYLGILASNSDIGLTVNVYQIENGSVSQYSTEYVKSSSPSDYYSNIKSGSFTLVQRS